MKKRLLIVFLFLAFASFSYFYYRSNAFVFSLKDHQIIKLVLKKNIFSPVQKELLIEVVNSQESIAKGFSSRAGLETADNQKIDGMLFIFPKKEIRQFWMKDMFFNLDICWLNDLSFISCERQVSFPQAGQKLKVYNSPEISNLVLETEPGRLSADDLSLKLFFKW